MSTPPASRFKVNRYAFYFVLVLLSGFLNLLSESWSPFFRLNLALHPMLGVFATVAIVWTLFQRIRSQVPGLTNGHLFAFLGVCMMAFVRAFTFRYLPEETSNLIAGAMAPVLFFVVGYFFLRVAPLLRHVARIKQGWLQIALVALWLLSFALGCAISLEAPLGRVAPWTFKLHALLGALATGIGLIVLIRPARGRMLASGLPQGIGLAVVVFLGTATLVNGAHRRLSPPPVVPEVTLHLSTEPLERRSSETRDSFPVGVSSEWVQISGSCGGEPCHATLLEEFRDSLHNLSYATEHMQKLLGLLEEEEGAGNRVICAGCHSPSVLFAGSPGGIMAAPTDSMSCVLCHAISDASVHEHEADYSLSFHVDHLLAFKEAERADAALGALDQMLIQLNPRAHGQVFRQPVLTENRLCESCHHRQRIQDEEQSCVTCHMEVRAVFGARDDLQANHFFPGANAGVLDLLEREEPARRTEKWMRSGFLTHRLEKLYEDPTEIRLPLGEAREKNYFYMRVGSAFVEPPEPGREAVLEITTKSTRMGHAFPTAALDMQECWLEVRVTDPEGSLVFASGGVDDDGRVLPDAHRLGGYLMGRDGERVERHRVWQTERRVLERELPPGGAIVDRYRFTVPEETRGFLTIDARWQYRKTGHAFWRWAYGEGSAPPTTTVMEHFGQHELG